MNIRKIILSAVVSFLAIVAFSDLAYAHRPYLIKQGTISDPDGNKVIKEKLYGDGIFSADPVTFQLRHKDGAVLANSPVGDHVATFCPAIKFCWAFPYGILLPLATGWVLDFSQINFNQPAKDYNLKGEEAETFKKYLLEDEVTRTAAHAFGYPEFSKSYSGFKPSSVIVI